MPPLVAIVKQVLKLGANKQKALKFHRLYKRPQMWGTRQANESIGTIKAWMVATHFLTKKLIENEPTCASLHYKARDETLSA